MREGGGGQRETDRQRKQTDRYSDKQIDRHTDRHKKDMYGGRHSRQLL